MKTLKRWFLKLAAIAATCVGLVVNGQTNTFPSSGNVGIGTASPTNSLEVVDDTAIASELDYALRIRNPSSTVGLLLGVSQNAGASVIQSFQPGVTWGDRPLSLMPNGGRVGVGTTTPLGLLTVWNTNVYDGGETNWAADSIALYGAVSGGNGGYFGGITWQNGGRRRAGIASVMEHEDSDFVGLAFFTQGTDGPGPMFESMRITRSGYVGIGTKSPDAPLHVSGGPAMTAGWNRTATLHATYPVLAFGSSAGKWAGIGYDPGWALRFWVNGTLNDVSGTALTAMSITPTGDVGIGTYPTHKLAVNGTVKAKEVIVETSGWADHVFAPDYALASLNEVEAHIREHRHLPGIPSAAQVEENGISLGEMQARILAKVEELTLHVIARRRLAAASGLRAWPARGLCAEVDSRRHGGEPRS